MPKTTLKIIVYGLTFIFLPLIFSQTLKSDHEDAEVTKYIYNYQVQYACDNWLNPKEDQEEHLTDLSEFICGIYLGMIQEQNTYHQSFINYFKKNYDDDFINFANVYTITGCNIEDLEHRQFAQLFLEYMDRNEDLIDYNFYAVVEQVLDPYCEAIRDKEIDFHLDEKAGRRVT